MPVCSCIVALDPHRCTLHNPICSCAVVVEMIACALVRIERENVRIAINNAGSNYGIARTCRIARISSGFVNAGGYVARIVIALIMRDPIHCGSCCSWAQELCTTTESMGKCSALATSSLLVPTHELIYPILEQETAMRSFCAPCTQFQRCIHTTSPTVMLGFVVEFIVPLALLQARWNDAFMPSSSTRMRECEKIASAAKWPLLIWVQNGGGCGWQCVPAKINKI